MKQSIQKTTRIGLNLFLLAGLVAGALSLSGAQTAQAQTQANTISYYDWFDLETGTIIQISPSDPVPAAADFRFSYNEGFSPHAVVFQNLGAGVQIAYSAEDYAHVTYNDVASLTLTTSFIDQPFNQVAVLLTPGGNYYKIGFVNESYPNVTFQWEQLIQCPAGRYDNGTGCVPADPGYYVPVAGATSQTPCEIGSYQPSSGATSCDPATPGHFVNTTGSAAQTECALGTYQPSYRSISCILASPGYYVNTTGATEQIMCDEGFTSEAGATECTPESVYYNFAGFASPVDNTLMNVAKAGQTIPLKWRVTDANGAPVTDLSATDLKVSVTFLTCDLGTTADAVEEYASGSSGLQNLGDGYYQYNWKTPKSYKNSCKTLTLDIGDGMAHTATFKFTK